MNRRSAMFWGLLLVLLGILMLLDQFNIIRGDMWDYFWPLAIIALGISMVFKNKKTVIKSDE
ncbi:MAG TPA: DUF5668 domain-containing protein [candidate division Zixibacteria bacterium]|nr:DUF5668 domain-containing protein [candidate division Zixibacteria bacterium]